MRRPALPSLVAATLAVTLLAGCGGSGGNSNANRNITSLHNPSSAPTATAPSVLPTPLAAGNLPVASAAGSAGGSGADTYVVAAGDTLGAIADKFGISLTQLEAFNPGVDPARLQIGQTLKIPKPGQTPGPSSTPTPQPSAALSTPGPQPSAASGPVNIPPTGGAPNGNGTPIPNLNGGGSTGAAASASATARPSAGAGEYVVKAGDSACAIATANKVTVQELAAANNLSVSQIAHLTVGQVLKLPPSTGHIGCT